MIRNTLIHRYQSEFERYVTNTASLTTSKRYSSALESFFSRFPDKNAPQDFNRADVEDFRVARRKSGISARSVNYEVQIVRAFWNWMINMELTSFNPAGHIRRFREMEPARYSLSEQNQEALYKVCITPLEKLLVGLALTTGLRATTLLKLDKEDVDFERGFLIVPPEKIKTQRALELPLRQDILELLREIPPGNLWGTWSQTEQSLSRRFTKICKRAGVGLRGLRTARRTLATTLLRNGADVRVVRDWLGHRNISTTSKYCTPATSEETQAALKLLPSPGHKPLLPL